MQIVTSVRAYQWPYTLYVFSGAAGGNSAKTLNETTNRGNNIFFSPSVKEFMRRDLKMHARHFFVSTDKHILKSTQTLSSGLLFYFPARGLNAL